MRGCLALFQAILLSGVFWLPQLVADDESGGQQQAEPVENRGQAVDAGYVVLDGHYVSPPYVPERRGDDLLINGQLALRGWFARHRGWPGWDRWQFGPGASRERGGPMGGFPMGGGPPGGAPPGFRGWGPRGPDALTRIESSLEDGALLLGGEGLRGGFVQNIDAICVLDILLSNDSPEVKHERILHIQAVGFDHDQWKDVIESFKPSAELAARIAPMAEKYRKIEEENFARHRQVVASAFLMSRPVKYTITLTAMGLVVAACGTLLNYRPQGRARWSDVDREGEGAPIVVRSVVLLVLLGLFDLGCTLVAEQAGGFTELNPLAGNLVSNPMLLVGFKLTTLLSACIILYALRRYRGAQVAAWWMCLLCTVLTFRWLTYNSMFMS